MATDQLKVSIGKEFKRIRIQNHMTQTDVAVRFDANKSLISAYENGRVNFTLDVIVKFCKIFDLNANDFINRFDLR